MADLTGKHAIVTGGARGIGLGIVRRLAGEGAKVAFTYNTSQQAALDIAKDLGVRAFQVDVSDPAAFEKVLQSMTDYLGGLDILVNNAGMAIGGPLADSTMDQYDLVMDVNVRAIYVASKFAAQKINDNGRVINIGSIVGERSTSPGITLYSATKAAVAALGRGLSRELGPRGVTVNTIETGAIDTDMNPSSSAHAPLVKSMTPLGRYGVPDDVAGLVAFLAGPDASHISGANVRIDGGFSA